MSQFVKKHISLPKELADKLEEYARSNGATQSGIITFALNYLFQYEGRDYPQMQEIISNAIVEKFQPVVNELEKLKQATNSFGVDNKIVIEILNSYLLTNQELQVYDSEKNKSAQLSASENLVKNRIAKQRQKKLSE